MCQPEAKVWTCYHHVDERKPGKHLTHMVILITYLGTVKMADPIGELNAVFAMCGIVNEVTHVNIINQEGFTQLSYLVESWKLIRTSPRWQSTWQHERRPKVEFYLVLL